ncbi:MAG: aminotransferase class V-fold PLP-dependent enzyme [Deltaproteobacteria bacterium]|nr:aminotransferase class V-fold PLP-dependent enzyme [Deltaproteobacteria bacterium]
MKKRIYMDNAATSFPKPPRVVEAMVRFMTEVGANPGRSTHEQSMEAAHIVDSTREKLARLFNIRDPKRIVFTLNATESLNTVIYGFLNAHDHVIVTQMEHNSVLRPIRHLEKSMGIEVSVIPCDKMGFLDLDFLSKTIRPTTALVCVNHASNVCGVIQDIKSVRGIIDGIPLLLDAAQTAGELNIDVEELGVDFLAFTGHKALLGPQGVGGLYVREGLNLEPLKRGGTGSFSESQDQPDFFPDAFESGTRNNVGIAGLGAAVDFLFETGIDTIRNHCMSLLRVLIDELVSVPGIVLYGPLDPEKQAPILSVTFDRALPDGLDMSFGGCGGRAIPATFETLHPHEVGTILRDEYEISVRVGLHCAPLAHQALGTFPDGTVRFSLGFFNTVQDVEITAAAIKRIAEK